MVRHTYCPHKTLAQGIPALSYIQRVHVRTRSQRFFVYSQVERLDR